MAILTSSFVTGVATIFLYGLRANSETLLDISTDSVSLINSFGVARP